MPEEKKTYTEENPRIFIFYWIFGLLFLVLLGSLSYRQIFLYDKYARDGERQTLRRVIRPGARGDIYDRHGRLLVGNRPLFSAVVYKDNIKREHFRERERLKRRIAAAGGTSTYSERYTHALYNLYEGYVKTINRYLGTDYGVNFTAFKKRFEASPMMPIPLVENLTAREHAILAERISVDSPVEIATDTARYYPYRDAAAQLLGYVKRKDYDDDGADMPGADLRTFAFLDKAGDSGMEKAFDSELAGKSGVKIWVVDHDSNRYDYILEQHPKKGRDIHTSIDIDIQVAAEEALGGRKGAVVALDVATGEVLAMASRPAYDLNLSSPRFLKDDYDKISSSTAFFPRATQGLYPPGSTFKLVTAVAGLESGAVSLDSMSHCTGSFMVGNRRFPCNSRYGHGWVNMSDAIAKSCNVFFYEYAMKIGADKISDTAKAFGLDSATGIEVGEESEGVDSGGRHRGAIVANPRYKAKYRPEQGSWSGGDTANMSIGQGFLRQTPVQMACFVASLARGETRTRASVLHDPDRLADMYYHGAQKMRLPQAQYDAIIRGMEEAVRSGTCRRAAVEGVRIAAKSGTAQIMDRGKPLDLAWMVAFAPVENPQIAVAVVVEGEETNDVAGGRTAGPVMKAVLQKFFEYAK